MSEKLSELTQDQFNELVSSLVVNTIDKWAKENGLDKIDKKFLMHPGVDEKELEAKNGAQRMMSMFKAAVRKDNSLIIKPETKSASPMIEGTDADGGYLVPAVTRAEIIRLIPTFAQARGLVRILPMGKTDTLNVPKKLTGTTATNVSEGSSITSHKPTLQTVQLLAKKFGDIIVLSNELIDDANVDIQRYVIELMAEALKKAGLDVSPVGLDYVLWNRGQQPYYKKGKPRHRTRTVFY